MARAVIATAIVLAAPTTAAAFQTEVDPGTQEWKREGLARWVRAEKKAAWLESVEEANQPRPGTGQVVAGAPPASSTYPTGVLSAAQVAAYATGAGFPADVVPTMVAIAYRESRFNPGAVNSSSGACGLWQMYPCPGPEALDPATNAAMAYAKYAVSGLAPWGY